jgi:hypothetical protein
LADESLYAAKKTGRNRVCSIAGLAKKNTRKVNEKELI